MEELRFVERLSFAASADPMSLLGLHRSLQVQADDVTRSASFGGAVAREPSAAANLALSSPEAPLVAILLCSFNGQAFLAEQLDSIAGQEHCNWRLVVSDDGSLDGTLTLLAAYQQSWGAQRLEFLAGPSRGFAANFLFLSCKADIASDFYAYADQDDVWHPAKLQRALTWLAGLAPGVPGLYCSRTLLIDERGCDQGYSPLFSKPPTFANALVQNVGGGNTMVFNAAAMALLREAGAGVAVVSHDWWLYLVVTGCGGEVFYDAMPSVGYRQHEGCVVGSNSSWPDRLVRFRMMLTGRFRAWNSVNIAALSLLRHRLTDENRKKFDYFVHSRTRWLLPRLIGLWRSGVYRQTVFGNMGLIFAALIKRL
ncbi:MAG: glycosyltransferase family 2 protein [Pseudomonas sp.]|uniref:glycosyltransferase family 2 protein n=1 Tax=Pseudomonas sp. TaxID=306 RepID=UPI003390AAD9